MSVILIVISGLTSMRNASLEAAARLRDGGHTVHFAAQLEVEEYLVPRSVTYHQLPALRREPAPLLPAVGRARKMLTAATTFGARRTAGIQALRQGAYGDLLDRIRPELVLLDQELHPFIFTTHGRKIPFLLVSVWFETARRAGLPPITSDLPPGDPQQIEGHWARHLRAGVRKRWQQRLALGFNDRNSVLRAYGKQSGFPLGQLRYDSWPPPFTYSRLPTLRFVMEELEFPYPPDPLNHYVGPMVGPAEAGSDLPDRLAGVLDAAKREGKKVIYAVGSSMEGSGGDGLRSVVAAVTTRPDWVLVLSRSGHSVELYETAPNVHVFDWVPQSRLLERVDCCINHAGIGTINECVFHGVPMVIYSGAQHDQPGCTARLRYHGLAVVGDRDDTPEAVAGRIEQALTSAELRRKVARYRDFARDPAVRNRLVSVVDSYLPA